MRSMARTMFAVLVAVCALGVIASASASASASAHEYFIAGKSMKELALTNETVSAESGSAVLQSTGVIITCGTVKGTGTIKAGGMGTGATEFANCIVEKPTQCVLEPFIIKTQDTLVEAGGLLKEQFKPAAGGPLVTLKFRSGTGCALSTVALKGQLEGLVASEAEKQAGELQFTHTSGTEIEGGGVPWTLTFNDKVQLSGVNKGKQWSAKK